MSTPASPTWHVDHGTLATYADGTATPLTAASVEEHLLGCDDCRLRLGPLMDPAPLDLAWESIRERVEAPAVGWLERILHWLGVSLESARLLVAVPAFQGAWLLGLLVVTFFAWTAAMFNGDGGLAMFLLVAPLAPVAGVAASFGGDADPSHELSTVAPYPGFRLLLLRSVGVLATSVPVMALAGLTMPGPAWLGVAWLTPALAGVTITLALSRLVGCTAAAVGVAVCWAVAVGAATRAHDPVEVVEPVMQLVLIALTLTATTFIVLRHQSFEHIGSQA
jgi:hypothetical protein